MFERFTEAARQVVVQAQDEARRLRHNYIGGEHLLLGLLSVEGIHRGVLFDHGLTLDTARERVVGIVSMGDEVSTFQIPFTPRAKHVLERSLREAIAMGHNYIDPFHILLGLQDEWRPDSTAPTTEVGKGVAAAILDEAGATREIVRERLFVDLMMRPPTDPPIWFMGAPPPRTRKRCDQAFAIFGARFTCQGEAGHGGDEHFEHGDGWTMRWTRE